MRTGKPVNLFMDYKRGCALCNSRHEDLLCCGSKCLQNRSWKRALIHLDLLKWGCETLPCSSIETN